MNNNHILSFICGAAIGASVALMYAKKRLAEVVDDYEDKLYEAEHKNDEPAIAEVVEVAPEAEKPDINEVISSYKGGESEEEKENGTEPYVIPPAEFGEHGFPTYELTYFADGVLADDEGEIVEDFANKVGADFAKHFGEYEEDSVFVRNETLKCDYEILKNLSTYAQYKKDNPWR